MNINRAIHQIFMDNDSNTVADLANSALTVNVPTGETKRKGLDLARKIRPRQGFQVRASYGYFHETYKNWSVGSVNSRMNMAGHKQAWTTPKNMFNLKTRRRSQGR
ncbi:MAG: hypothetical protein LBO66_07405 [Deltaproteobacteria bacterium]|nr:hypothetical protein [Deltaproteobacteria bacterium]